MQRRREALAFGELIVDPESWEVRLNGATIPLTPTEFKLLFALASRPNRVVGYRELTETVWGRTWFEDDGNIAVHISNLRAKLGESGTNPRFIRSVRGIGYRFEPSRIHAIDASPVDHSQRGQPVVFVLLAMNRGIRWIGANVAALLGWEPEDLIGVHVLDLAQPDDVPQFLAVRAALNDGLALTFSARFATNDGGYRQLRAAVRPIYGVDDKPTGVLAEWHPADDESVPQPLTPICLHSDHLPELTIAATLTYDADFKVVRISPPLPIGDWEPEEIIGAYFSPSGRDEESTRALLQTLVESGVRELRAMTNLRLKDGRMYPIHCRYFVEVDNGNGITGFRTTVHLPQIPHSAQ